MGPNLSTEQYDDEMMLMYVDCMDENVSNKNINASPVRNMNKFSCLKEKRMANLEMLALIRQESAAQDEKEIISSCMYEILNY